MLKKLMKYDLIWINKFMLIYFVITFIISIMTRIASCFNDSFVGNLIYLILRGCAISGLASSLINCVIRIWVRFRNNMYKDEAYLTHTLPVSKDTLYNSKILSAMVSIIIALLVIGGCFLIVFLDDAMIDALKDIFNNSDLLFIFISLIITALLEVIYMVYSGIMGILIGHRSNNNKAAKTVLFGVILYFIIQLVILGIVYFIGLLDSNLNSLFINSNNLDLLPVKNLFIIINIVYLLFTIGMYFTGRKLLIKGINVD